MKFTITSDPNEGWKVSAENFERQVFSLPENKSTTCPNCSNYRKPENRKKKVFKKWDKGEMITFACIHCEVKGYAVHDVVKQDIKPSYKPVQVQSIKSDHFLEYWKMRGISENTLSSCGVKSISSASAFIYTRNGEQVGVKYRNFSDDKSNRRIWCEKGSRKIFWGIDNLNPKNDKGVIICEGEADLLSLYEAGFNSVISVPFGASDGDNQGGKINEAMQDAHNILSKFDSYIIATDGDKAGLALGYELARRLGKGKCKLVNWPDGCKDANDALLLYGDDELRQIINDAPYFPIEGITSFSNEKEGYDEIRRNGFPELKGIDFDFGLDENFKFILSQLTFITGVPNHGKTVFLFNLLVHLAKAKKWKFGIYSPEQQAPSSIEGTDFPPHAFLFEDLIEITVGRPAFKDKYYQLSDFENVRIDQMNDQEYQAGYKFVNEHFKIINPPPGSCSIDDILFRAERLILEHGINAIIIDPWNRVEGMLGMDNKETGEVLSKLNRWKALHDMHIFIVAHPVKGVGYTNYTDDEGNTHKIPNPPTAHDIKGGGEIFDMADNIFTVYRHIQEGWTSFIRNKIKFSRMLGGLGQTKYKFFGANGRFYTKDLEQSIKDHTRPFIDVDFWKDVEEKENLPF